MSINSSIDFPFIKGMTFGLMAKKGDFAVNGTYKSFDMMRESLNINTVILPVAAWQRNAQSTEVDYKSEKTVSDWEIENMIDYAHKNGLRVILKPMVNLTDGTMRANIDFFDSNVPSEQSWGRWFKSYQDFILHMAGIAQKTGCSIFSVGCELVQSEKRESEWRSLIAAVREVYDGFITYGTDKYKEDCVTWWDAVDLISSSGYYACGDIPAQVERIKDVVLKQNKPFMFLEAGCKGQAGAVDYTNKREINTPVNSCEQAEYYKKLFCATKDLPWFFGYGLCDWPLNIYSMENAGTDTGYCVYGKEAQNVVSIAYA